MTSGRRRSGAARRQQQQGRAAAVPAYYYEEKRTLLVVPRRCCHGSFLSGASSVLRGAPLPRIVGSPAHRRRQPKPLGLTVAGSTLPRHSVSFSGGLFLSWFTYCGRMILDREHT
ncbi:hypothetical protein HPB52_021162 [Rhipicephalus sanguineus]|uniref:Uncharacterized protein n=1 Tax=Rhipicephalus sanguineus TaxID=34632 RepID=A0A9D4T051_RHISA|nr:hypothetical protein HPB52_021162 [Rhipicephalus sanguineus]